MEREREREDETRKKGRGGKYYYRKADYKDCKKWKKNDEPLFTYFFWSMKKRKKNAIQ